MAQFPALPLWTDAYLADTLDLSLEDHAFYLLLMMLAWRRPDNALPDDMPWLKRSLSACCAGGVHGHTFNARVPKLLNRFWSLQDGKWHQKRLDRERTYLTSKSERQRQTALKRWSKESQTKFKSESNSSQTHSGFEKNQQVTECKGYAPTPTPTHSKTPIPLSESESSTTETYNLAPDGACNLVVAPPRKANGSYRWAGHWIRIDEPQFQQWAISYHALDLASHLQNLDDYLCSPEAGDRRRKGWFNFVSASLSKRHGIALKLAREGRSPDGRMPSGNWYDSNPIVQ